MTTIHETAYPRIKPHLSPKEFKEIFAPTDDELCLLNVRTKATLPVTRLGFMMLLKCYQYLGRPVQLQKIQACHHFLRCFLELPSYQKDKKLVTSQAACGGNWVGSQNPSF